MTPRFFEKYFHPCSRTFTDSRFHFLFAVEWVTCQVWLQWPTVSFSLKLRSNTSSKYWVDGHDHHNSTTRRCSFTVPHPGTLPRLKRSSSYRKLNARIIRKLTDYDVTYYLLLLGTYVGKFIRTRLFGLTSEKTGNVDPN